MSKLSELIGDLEKLGIYNYDKFAGHGNVYIALTYSDVVVGGPRFTVVRSGYYTIPNPRPHYENKTFPVGRVKGDKAKALTEAKKWAGVRYRITAWTKTPFGSWMDATFVATRLADLKAQLKVKEAPKA